MKKIIWISIVAASAVFAESATDMVKDAAVSKVKTQAKEVAIKQVAGNDSVKQVVTDKIVDTDSNESSLTDKVVKGATK